MDNYIKTIRKKVGHAPIRSVAVSCIIENQQGEILLQKRSDTKTYGTPGGNLELEEKIMDGLKREVLEETGIELADPKLFGIYSGKNQAFHYPNKDITYYTVIVFYEKIENPVTLRMDKESVALTFFRRNELPLNIQKTDEPWIEKWQNHISKIVID